MNTSTEVIKEALTRLYEVYTEKMEIALTSGMTKDEASAAVAVWLDAQLDGGAR